MKLPIKQEMDGFETEDFYDTPHLGGIINIVNTIGGIVNTGRH